MPEEASQSAMGSKTAPEDDSEEAAAAGAGRRHLSAKERKLLRKQVCANSASGCLPIVLGAGLSWPVSETH